MRRIIKEGKKPKKYKTIYKTTCPKCKCIFEFEDEDITGEKRINGSKSVICPCCNHTIILYTGDHGNEGNYTERKEEINEIINQKEPGSNFEKYVYDPNPLRQVVPLGTYTPKDYCTTCIHKDGPKDALGNPTVGDSLCQWCRHYKYRVTCVSSSLTGDVTGGIEGTTGYSEAKDFVPEK